MEKVTLGSGATTADKRGFTKIDATEKDKFGIAYYVRNTDIIKGKEKIMQDDFIRHAIGKKSGKKYYVMTVKVIAYGTLEQLEKLADNVKEINEKSIEGVSVPVIRTRNNSNNTDSDTAKETTTAKVNAAVDAV